MRITVGLTKKVGLPGYGSLAASCQVESSEFSAGLSSADFSCRVRQAYDACRQAVEEELGQHLNVSSPASPQCSPSRNEGGNSRPATPKQLNALRGLSAKSRLSRGELDRIFGGKPLGALTVQEASAAIDRLKGSTGGAAANGVMKGAV